MAAVQKYDTFQAISDPTRRKILELLSSQELPITEISKQFPISRTAVSKHLRVLSESKLVSVEKVGREKRYKLKPESLQELKQWLSYFDQFWDNKISMLKHLVENDDKQDMKIVEGTPKEFSND